MDISQTNTLRRSLGWVASALLFAALLSLADALREGFLDGGRIFQAIPGEVVSFTSPLPPGAERLEEITQRGGDRFVTLRPGGMYTGFWLGGAMWRGEIVVADEATPGERVFTLEGPAIERPKGGPAGIVITVRVHRDAMAKQLASASFITRHFGIKPYLVSLCALAGALLAGAGVYAASWRMERLLTLQGKGLVYMMKKTEEGAVIGFSLGARQGLSPGMTVGLYDKSGRAVGQAKVTASLPADATALVLSGSCDIGDMVMLPAPTAPAASPTPSAR